MSLTAKIDEIFSNPEKASEENINGLVLEAIRMLNDLKERLESKDEQVRTRALEDAKRMQSQLQEQMEKMEGLLPNMAGSAFARENAFSQALQKLQQNLIDQTKQKKPKRVKEWLAS